MKIIRRDVIYLLGIAAAVPAMSKIAWAQTQAGPKLTQILRKDLEGQGQVVQETVVSVVDFGPGAGDTTGLAAAIIRHAATCNDG